MIVVSDLIGTLTTGSPVIGLVNWVKNHQSKFRANLYMAKLMPTYFLAKMNWINYQKWASGTMFSCLPLMKNVTPEMIEEMANWAVDKQLWPKRRSEVVERLQQHKNAGAEVYIASSVYAPTVTSFAKRIGIKAIGTPVEIINQQLTITSPLAASDHKIERILTELGVDQVDIAYGDTWQDIPMLENAKHAVAVYPDQRLKETALKRGWEILGSRK